MCQYFVFPPLWDLEGEERERMKEFVGTTTAGSQAGRLHQGQKQANRTSKAMPVVSNSFQGGSIFIYENFLAVNTSKG